MRHITLITTGGTIEKTYDEQSGQLLNRRSIVQRMLRRLRLEDATIGIIELLSKDSLHLTDADRQQIADVVRATAGTRSAPGHTGGVVILHGTDTLAVTGEKLCADIPDPAVPIILTGAMRPYEMSRSDALQNLTEALFATGIARPAVYASAHGRLLSFPGVRKDRERGTFTKD
jgi:L-asparaginase